MRVVVDTNVIVVTNGLSEQASDACVAACIDRLEGIQRGTDILVLDDAFHIISEYCANCRETGQPGVGDAFLKWVLTNWRNSRWCECVTITQVGEDDTTFGEFPTDPRLAGFDPSDRKFVAVVLAHPERPPVLQAVDTKWWGHREALAMNGAQVVFLCGRDPRGYRQPG